MANAFSAEPGCTTACFDDIQWRVIWQRLVRELSVKLQRILILLLEQLTMSDQDSC